MKDKNIIKLKLNDQQLKIVRRNLEDPTLTSLSPLKHIKVFSTTNNEIKHLMVSENSRKDITDLSGDVITTIASDFTMFGCYDYSVYYRNIKTGSFVAIVGSKNLQNDSQCKLVLVQDFPFTEEFIGEKEFLDKVKYSKVEDLYSFFDYNNGTLAFNSFYYDNKKGVIFFDHSYSYKEYFVHLFKPNNEKEAYQELVYQDCEFGMKDKVHYKIYYTSNEFAITIRSSERRKKNVIDLIKLHKHSNVRHEWGTYIRSLALPDNILYQKTKEILSNLTGNEGYTLHLQNEVIKKVVDALTMSTFPDMSFEYLKDFYSDIYSEVIEDLIRNNQKEGMITKKPVIVDEDINAEEDAGDWKDMGDWIMVIDQTDTSDAIYSSLKEEYTPSSMKEGETVLLEGEEFELYSFQIDYPNIFPPNAFSVRINGEIYKLSDLWWQGSKKLKEIESGKEIFRVQKILSPVPKIAYLYRRIPLGEQENLYPWIFALSNYYNIAKEEEKQVIINWAKEINSKLTPGVIDPFDKPKDYLWAELINQAPSNS